MVIFGLLVIFLIVLLAPFFFKAVERNLEVFLLGMGILAAVVSGEFSVRLIQEAVVEPVKITGAVLSFGILFRWSRQKIRRVLDWLTLQVTLPVFIFLVVVVLGLASSVITAIISSLLLVEIISALRLERRFEVHLVVIACFSIGLGAALTSIGEPLSTILVAKLKGPPHYASVLYPLGLVGFLVIPGIFILGILPYLYLMKWPTGRDTLEEEEEGETVWSVLLRAIRVYAFVMALLFLGSGFKPIIDEFVIRLPGLVLYWVNMVSAILDNATLTAAEIGPALSEAQIRDAIMGLLIAGGMLIPGNIPNIISAHKLHITSKEWAWTGVPIGIFLMLVYFLVLLLLPR